MGLSPSVPPGRAAEFEALRPRLLRVAYATLGSWAEAEDVVQEAWLRLQRADAEEIHNLGAWLTTVVGRLALDALGSARARRERYYGEWLPEPVVAEAPDPADRVTLDEQVSLAMLRVLESLSPAERTAFVLHDVFGHSFDEVAEAVGRTPQAARQLASRARRHVEAGRPRFPATPDEQRRVVSAFLSAAVDGDVDGLLAVLDPEVTLRADGGGRVQTVRRPVHGAERVARTLAGFARMRTGRGEVADVNGTPGLVVRTTDGELSVFAFTVDGGRITAIDVVRNPDKLERVPPPPSGD